MTRKMDCDTRTYVLAPMTADDLAESSCQFQIAHAVQFPCSNIVTLIQALSSSYSVSYARKSRDIQIWAPAMTKLLWNFTLISSKLKSTVFLDP